MAIGFNEKDFKESSTGFEVLPPGDYKVRCTTGTIDTKSKAGMDQIKMEMEIIEGPQMGKKVWNYLTDGPKASVFIGIALNAFSIPLNTTSVNAKTFIGRVAMVKTEVNDGGYAQIKKLYKCEAVVEEQELNDDGLPF